MDKETTTNEAIDLFLKKLNKYTFYDRLTGENVIPIKRVEMFATEFYIELQAIMRKEDEGK